MMKLEEIRELIQLMRENQIAEIDLEQEGRRIRVVAAQAPIVPNPSQPLVVVTGGSNSVSAEAQAAVEPPKEPEKVEGKIIPSPIVGTFYRSPSPESPVYANVGDEIDEDSVLCIVEAMKVMNEIKAEIAGKILEILAENGHPVEFGQPLFRVLPAS